MKMFHQETQTYRRHRHIEDRDMYKTKTHMDTDICKTQKLTQTIARNVSHVSGFSLAAATSNDPLAAGNIAATLVTDYISDPTLIKTDFFALKIN